MISLALELHPLYTMCERGLMKFRVSKEAEDEPSIPATPPAPKPPTYTEQLTKELQDLDAVIKGAQDARAHVVESLMFLKFTPRAEEQMKAIWEHIKPR
jgi:hypothetical protein